MENKTPEDDSPELRGLEFDDQSDPDSDDIFYDCDSHTLGSIAHQDEVDIWNKLPMEEKWKDVMGLLQSREFACRWDASCGDSSVTNYLQGYKREGLKIKDHREVRSPTALHILAKDFNKNGFEGLDEKSKQRIISFLLEDRNNEADSESSSKIKILEDPILIVAFRHDNKDFITFLLSRYPESVKDLLHASDERGINALHHLFRDYFPKVIQDYLREISAKELELRTTYDLAASFVKIASPKTIAAQDKNGNTPLHYALDYRLCRIPNAGHRKLVFLMIEVVDELLREQSNKGRQFNNMDDPESPYLYFLRTQREFLETLPKKATSGIAAQRLLSKGSMVQDNSSRDLNSSLYASEDDSNSWAMNGGEFEHRRVEAFLELRLQGASSKEYVEEGKSAPFTLPEKAPSGYDKQPPHDAQDGSNGLGRAGTQNFRRRIRPLLFHTETQETLEDRDLDYEGHSSAIGMLSAVQILAPSSQLEDSSKQPGNAQHGTIIRSIKESVVGSNAADDEQDHKHAADQIRHELKLHYIRTRSDIDAKDLLYGKIASDKNLFFDATHLRDRTSADIAGVIKMLSQPGGFEDTLSYVYLPRLSRVEGRLTNQASRSRPQVANQGRQRMSNLEKPRMTGRESLIEVFVALAKAGVRKILHLQVDDIYENGLQHTDTAIEESVRGVDRFFDRKQDHNGIDIECWDWIKPDLSIDVISFAAPNAVTIHLYWGGNETVLRGWAREKGIPGVYRNGKKLRTVVLHASPGLERATRRQRALDQFKHEIVKSTNSRVNVVVRDWAANKAAESRADSLLKTSAVENYQTPPDHDWVKSMEGFRRSLLSVHKCMPREVQARRTKVALIDDGVNLSSLNTYDQTVQVTGLSYRTTDFTAEGTFIGQPWHQSTRGHGTTMAKMLLRVCPWVILYVIRIQDQDDKSSNGVGSIRIHAESAAKAVRAAITRDVDIITMSWTVRDIIDGGASNKAPNTYEEQAIGDLKTAIDAAKSRQIIMFCSASDEITRRSTDSLPFSQAPHYIFRIGAAGPSGQRDMKSEDQKDINWFFPGNQVAEAIDPRLATVPEHHSGSSISTALAAGLASLVMYLPRLMQAYHEHNDGEDSEAALKFAAYSSRLRKRANMKQAFDNITDPSHEDKKFLPVWHMFGRQADLMKKSHGLGATSNTPWPLLDELVNGLCSKLPS